MLGAARCHGCGPTRSAWCAPFPVVGTRDFRDRHPSGVSGLGMGQRAPEERRAWGPTHSIRAVHTDRLARTIVQRIDMAGHRGRLHRHPFAPILGRLQEALDAGGAVYPVTQGHRQCLVRGEASEQVRVSHVRVAPQQRASLIRMMAAVVGTCVERWHVIGSPGKRRNKGRRAMYGSVPQLP